MRAYPKAVQIVEVGPRDGLQNEAFSPDKLPLESRVGFIVQLLEAGIRTVEIGSFVRPDLVPQMADTPAIAAALQKEELDPAKKLIALATNVRGLERAAAAKIKNIAVFTAASDAFSLANVKSSREESLQHCAQVCAAARKEGIAVRGYLSTAWWCPFSGKVPSRLVRESVQALLEMGCYEVSVADTIGYATPTEVSHLLRSLIGDVGADRLAVHFHDSRGTALANVLTSLQEGIFVVDSAAGGLGGCPFAPGAAGNLSTEDLVFMLEGMKIDTEIDLTRLRLATLGIESDLKKARGAANWRLPSRYLQAGPLELSLAPPPR